MAAPEIFDTDYGVQFTRMEFIGCFQSRGITISMDGRGCALDNIFVERLCLNDYLEVRTAQERLGCSLDFYNGEAASIAWICDAARVYCGLKQEGAA